MKIDKVVRNRLWSETLSLWKELSGIRDCKVKNDDGTDMTVIEFKNKILKSMGVDRLFGCPFCDEYYASGECPIYVKTDIMNVYCSNRTLACYFTVYKKWEDGIVIKGKHIQVYAEKFYEYLMWLYWFEKEKGLV